jgi:hypothetical protein
MVFALLIAGAVCGAPFSARLPLAKIISIPPEIPKGDVPYQELTCSDQDKKRIAEIITTMADKGKLYLYMNQEHLKKLGKQIDHVHPLKFLATIFADGQLAPCMSPIFEDFFKRVEFLRGLEPSLTREHLKGKLEQYIDDFARELSISSQELRPFFKRGNWEELVRYLMYKKGA